MRTALRLYTVLVLAFLVVPLLVVVPLSFSAGDVLTLPVPALSMRWYADFFTSGRWLASTRNSLVVGTATAVLATGVGTLAALGLFLGRFSARLPLAVLSVPLVVPAVIAGVSMYFAFALVGLTNSFAGLILAHTVLALPLVVVTVLAALQGFDRALLRAASSLGAPFAVVLWRVVLPLIAPAVGAGALFAFVTSFDEVIVALFIAGPEQFTLPRQMLAGLREFLNPTICAAAVLLSAVSLLLLALHQVLLGRGR